MPKKHSGSKKSKSEKQSRMQQWVTRFRTFVDRAGRRWVHRGPNRKDIRKYRSEYFKSAGGGRQHAADKGRRKATLKFRNRQQRKATRQLHQDVRRARS